MEEYTKHGKRNLFLSILGYLFFLVLHVSCSFLFNSDIRVTTTVANEVGQCVVTVSSDFSSRSAFPSALPITGVNYFATISYENNGTKYLGEHLPNDGTNDIPRFVFTTPSVSGDYKITLFLCSSETYSDASCIASGSAIFHLDAGQCTYSGPLSVPMICKTSTTGNGSVSLKYSFDSSLGVASADVSAKKNGDVSTGFSFSLDDTKTTGTLSASNLSAGVYTVTLSLKDSSGVAISLENPIQTITVYSGFETNKWFNCVTSGSDALTVSKATQTTFYVCGTDPSFYGKENGITSVTVGNDSTGDGSMLKPFKTVQNAVVAVIDANATLMTPGSVEYFIYVDGTFTDTDEDKSTNGNAFVNIESDEKLTLTIASFSGSNATINANRSESSTKARVMNIKMTDTSESSITLKNLILTGGYIEDMGGGVYVSKNSNLTITNCIITKNKSKKGGGVYIDENSSFTMESGTISYNTSTTYDGGGVYANGTFKMSGGTISNNTVETNDGGGVYANGTFSMSGGIIGGESDDTGNTATNGNGGGVCVGATGKFTMSGTSKISGNTALYGGGVCTNSYSGEDAFTMDDGTISGNTAICDLDSTKGGSGGGVYVKEVCKFTMNGGTISGNTANSKTVESTLYGGNGGGVCVVGTFEMTSDDCFITGNTAHHAAGVDISSGTFTMDNGTISNNHATGSDAGGVYVSGPFTMNGGTISGNTAITNSGGVRVGANTFTMTGGTISGNGPGEGATSLLGGGVCVSDDFNAKFTLSGTAQITSDNDVYLPAGKVITIGGKLTLPDGVTTVATITPSAYTVGGAVLELVPLVDLSSSTSLADEVGKFALSNSSWSISNYGKLQNFANIAFLESAPSSGTTVICNSAAGMNKIATWVNSGSSLLGVTINLTNDIELNDEFEPIGSGYDGSSAFKGTFDGNKHTIRGLDTTNSNISYPALFGCVKGTIKNLTVEGSSNCAGIVGTLLSNGVIDNCVNKVNVTSESKFAAGIVASLNGGTVKNCINEGNITNEHNYCGGIFAHDNMIGSTILNCTNTGETKGSSFVGGIGGFLFCNLYNCVNTGSVTASDRYCGGIIGNCATSTPNAGVFNSYNTGEVKGTSYVGGIVGCADISSSLNYYAYVINCYNSGDVTISSGAATSIGGVVGGIESGGTGTAKIADCYYLQSTATNGVGSTNGISVTTESFNAAYILNDGAHNNLYEKLNEWVTTNNMSGSEYYLTSEPRYKAWTNAEAPVFSE